MSARTIREFAVRQLIVEKRRREIAAAALAKIANGRGRGAKVAVSALTRMAQVGLK